MKEKLNTKERLFETATVLFAQKGYDSVSVREICKKANTSINMIHHYFENKEGLLNAIVETFTDQVFALPLRIVEKTPRTREEFTTKMRMFFEQTLEALIGQRHLLVVVMRHEVDATSMAQLIQKFVQFLEKAQKQGFVRRQIDPQMISGCLMDRVVNQVLYASKIKKFTGFDLVGDSKARQRWCEGNLDLFLYGLSHEKT